MTILFFSRLFYPHIGGVEKHVFEISKKLIERGYQIIVVTELSEKASKNRENYKGIHIYRIPELKDNWFRKFKIWLWLWKNSNLILETDIIHCHDVFFWHLPFRFLYPTKPVYTTFHGYETKFPPSKKAILVRKISEKLSFGNICVGEYIAKWYGTKANFVVHGGVDIAAGLKEKENKELRILLVGRLEKDIGIETYIKLLEALKKKEIRFTFEVCGDGSLRKDVEQYGTIHGFVNNVSKYLDGASIIFVSSYLLILESFASKRLVVATYNNKLKEDYLKMTPFVKWIIIEGNPEILAEKIIYYSQNPKEKQKLIKNTYEWARKQTWDKVTDTYIRLWNI